MVVNENTLSQCKKAQTEEPLCLLQGLLCNYVEAQRNQQYAEDSAEQHAKVKLKSRILFKTQICVYFLSGGSIEILTVWTCQTWPG